MVESWLTMVEFIRVMASDAVASCVPTERVIELFMVAIVRVILADHVKVWTAGRTGR